MWKICNSLHRFVNMTYVIINNDAENTKKNGFSDVPVINILWFVYLQIVIQHNFLNNCNQNGGHKKRASIKMVA